MLVPQLELLIDVAGDTIWLRDKTGAYDANNVGGFGDPNRERNEVAILAYAKRIDVDGTEVVLTFISDQIAWNGGLTNTEESEFQITLDEDGHVLLYFFHFHISTDGVNNGEGTPLVGGDIVFYNGELQTFNDPGFTVVDPLTYDNFIDDVLYPQIFCEDIVMPNIILKYNDKYKEYRDKRLEGCEDLSPFRDELFDLRLSIEGTEYAFRSNLKAQARTNLEELHNEND